jgi:hypothetical protein
MFLKKSSLAFFSSLLHDHALVRLKFGHSDKIQACPDPSRPTEINSYNLKKNCVQQKIIGPIKD